METTQNLAQHLAQKEKLAILSRYGISGSPTTTLDASALAREEALLKIILRLEQTIQTVLH